MIDEIKLLLDQVKNVPDVALWILGGFLFYKLVTYLSLTGSIVYVIKMLCKTSIDYQIKPRKAKFRGVLINDDAEHELEDLFTEMRHRGNMSYIHHSDVKELRRAWEESKAKKAPKVAA